MAWINNTKKSKPEIDERYKDGQYSVEVIIHLKNGLTFLAYYDYVEEVWWAEITRIKDDEVMFWCRIPKLPKLNKDERQERK